MPAKAAPAAVHLCVSTNTRRSCSETSANTKAFGKQWVEVLFLGPHGLRIGGCWVRGCSYISGRCLLIHLLVSSYLLELLFMFVIDVMVWTDATTAKKKRCVRRVTCKCGYGNDQGSTRSRVDRLSVEYYALGYRTVCLSVVVMMSNSLSDESTSCRGTQLLMELNYRFCIRGWARHQLGKRFSNGALHVGISSSQWEFRL